MVASERQIVEEVSGWLKVYADGSIDREWSGSPEVKFMSDLVPPHPHFVNGVSTRDVIADPASSGLRLRLYLPEVVQHNHKLPILLHFHGGGFCISQPDWFMYYNFYTRLAKEAGVICVSVYLPLAPEQRLPASCDVGYSALLWLCSVARGHAPEPWLEAQADFTRVFLIGDSSGGNVVHQVAARAGGQDLSPVKLAGAIPIHPGFCRSERSRSEMEQSETPFLTLDMLDKFIRLALPVGSTKDHPITCPMGSAAPPLAELRLPPMLLCLAENDLIIDTEMEYYEAMKKANKELELLTSNGVGHSFYLNKLAVDSDPNTAAQTVKLIDGIKDFIGRHLVEN